MKRIAIPLGMTFIMGLVLGIIGTQVLNAQQELVKATLVLKADLVGMPGQEVVMQRAELAPRASGGKHVHPGHEVIYVLAGSGTKEVEGEAAAPIKAGDAAYIPAGKVTETTNGSATEPLKFLVFRIHPKGQEITTKTVTEPHGRN